MSLKLLLEEAARRYGKKTAIASGAVRLSYAELDKSSDKMANALLGMGVGKGDRVAMLIPNSTDFAVIYFGVVKIGAIAVTLDIKYKVGELASIFNHCRPKVLVTESPYLEPIIPLLPDLGYIENIIDMSAAAKGRFVSYQEIMAKAPGQRIEVWPEPEDVAHIAYTSGPTFHPMGVMVTHGRLVQAIEIAAAGFQQTENDVVVLFALPMHHAVGLVVILLASIGRGSTVIMLSSLSIDGLMETIEKEAVTIFMGVPFIHALILKQAESDGIKSDLSSLRICASAGAPLPISIIKRFQQHLGLKLIQFYGLTEGTAHVTCQALDGSGQPGSVGKALSGWQLKVVDSAGRELPPDEPGEIVIKGPIMKGYYQDPQATARAIKDGWLYTSDIGRMDEAGHLFVMGLKKSMIISKGQNIYPSDIEVVLSSHPKVAEVAVVGIPDDMRGEVVGAAIRLKAGETVTEQQIKKFCLERMANYKVPKQIIFLDSLPQDNGKISKRNLREYLLAAYSKVAGKATP